MAIVKKCDMKYQSNATDGYYSAMKCSVLRSGAHKYQIRGRQSSSKLIGKVVRYLLFLCTVLVADGSEPFGAGTRPEPTWIMLQSILVRMPLTHKFVKLWYTSYLTKIVSSAFHLEVLKLVYT